MVILYAVLFCFPLPCGNRRPVVALMPVGMAKKGCARACASFPLVTVRRHFAPSCPWIAAPLVRSFHSFHLVARAAPWRCATLRSFTSFTRSLFFLSFNNILTQRVREWGGRVVFMSYFYFFSPIPVRLAFATLWLRCNGNFIGEKILSMRFPPSACRLFTLFAWFLSSSICCCYNYFHKDLILGR